MVHVEEEGRSSGDEGDIPARGQSERKSRMERRGQADILRLLAVLSYSLANDGDVLLKLTADVCEPGGVVCVAADGLECALAIEAGSEVLIPVLEACIISWRVCSCTLQVDWGWSHWGWGGLCLSISCHRPARHEGHEKSCSRHLGSAIGRRLRETVLLNKDLRIKRYRRTRRRFGRLRPFSGFPVSLSQPLCLSLSQSTSTCLLFALNCMQHVYSAYTQTKHSIRQRPGMQYTRPALHESSYCSHCIKTLCRLLPWLHTPATPSVNSPQSIPSYTALWQRLYGSQHAHGPHCPPAHTTCENQSTRRHNTLLSQLSRIHMAGWSAQHACS